MATCNDCIHGDICHNRIHYHADEDEFFGYLLTDKECHCEHFKDASKLVELPCKVGDIIYTIVSREIKENEIISINYISTTKITSFTFLVKNYRGLPLTYTEESIGEITFLTREEAEKALKERENNG